MRKEAAAREAALQEEAAAARREAEAAAQLVHALKTKGDLALGTLWTKVQPQAMNLMRQVGSLSAPDLGFPSLPSFLASLPPGRMTVLRHSRLPLRSSMTLQLMEAHARATEAVKAPIHRPGRKVSSTQNAESDDGVLSPLQLSLSCFMHNSCAFHAWMLHTGLTDTMLLHALS